MALFGLIFHIFGLDLTFFASKFKVTQSKDLGGSLNNQYNSAAQSFLSVFLLAHGDTSPLIFAAPYDSYFAVSEPHKLHCEVRKVINQFKKKMHGYIIHYAPAHVTDPDEFIDAFRIGECTDILSIIDYIFRSDYVCVHIKKHSIDAPPSTKAEFKGTPTLIFCLHCIEKIVHDQGIYNIFTKSLTKKQYIQLIQVKKKTL